MNIPIPLMLFSVFLWNFKGSGQRGAVFCLSHAPSGRACARIHDVRYIEDLFTLERGLSNADPARLDSN